MTSEEPLSAKEIHERADISLSTVYRRVEDLVERDLLAEEVRLAADGSHHSVYVARLDHLDVDLADGEFEVSARLRGQEDAPARFTQMWDRMRTRETD